MLNTDRAALFGMGATEQPSVFGVHRQTHLVPWYAQEVAIEQNNQELGKIASKVSAVKSVSFEMRTMLGDQLETLDDMGAEIDGADTSLARIMNKMTEMTSGGGTKSMCFLALFIVAVFFILYLLASYLSE